MNKSKGLLVVGVVMKLALTFTSSAFAATPPLTTDQIRKIDTISSNRSVVPESILPKTNDYSGEDELPIPEGVKPIQGMNLPLTMREVKIYGLDHKPYGIAFLREAVSKAVKYHNSLKGAPALKGGYKISRKGNSYSILVNSQTYLAFVYAVAQEITKKYQSDQFLLARAIIPEQTINQKSGSIEICVAEGYLSSDPNIVFAKNTKNNEKLRSLIAPHLNSLKNQKPLNFENLERSLLLIRDMPGVEIKTTFKQAISKNQNSALNSSSICKRALKNGAGSTSLEVRATVDEFDGEASIDNFGTEALGPEIMRFKVGVNSKFKAGDRYALSIGNATDSDETLNFAFNAQVPIGVNGLKAKMFHSNGVAEPGGFIVGLNVKNETVVTGVSIEYPYIRSRKENLTFEVGLRMHDVVTDTGSLELEKSNLNTLRLRSTYDFSDKNNGVNLISGELVVGLSGNFTSGIGTNAGLLDENFVMARGEIARYQAVRLSEKSTGSMTWINSLSWQYTDDPLFSSEEFALGGRDYGRGYDLAIITGDQAIAFKTELQYTNKTKYGKYKTYGFADYGKVKNIDNGSAAAGIKNRSLVSVGVGVDFETKNNWFAKLEITNPVSLSESELDEVDTRTYFQIGYRW